MFLYNNPLVKGLASLMGYIMEGIYFVFSHMGFYDIGLCIIVFTIVIRMFLLPMQVKQQKFSKLNAIMSPEIKAIQDKYKGKKDQETQMKQQAEIKEVYAKYGTSPTGSCLQLLIQMPILFALYAVIRDIPKYVSSVRGTYVNYITKLTTGQVDEYFGSKAILGKEYVKGKLSGAQLSKGQISNCIAAMNGTSSTGKTLSLAHNHTLRDLLDNVHNQYSNIMSSMNKFCGLLIGDSPSTNIKGQAIGIIIAGIALPVLSGVFQFVSVQLTTRMNKNNAAADVPGMGGSMKIMNFIMPIFSIYMCYILPVGIGIYWCIGSLVMMVQQLCINKYLDKKGMDAIIEENRKKAAKKAERKKARKGIYRENVIDAAQNKAKAKDEGGMSAAEKEAKLQKAKEAAAKKQGSLASKANLVSDYNKKNNK
ncbi:MAG: YidC/Oxa1 family membrane protein insertase [Eubacterium sp.]|nr:YidC/Oxa1 family membrane protein insertase [Eubacterium sp.]